MAGVVLTAADVMALTAIMADYLAINSTFSASSSGQRIPPSIEQNADYRHIWQLTDLPDAVTPQPPSPSPSPSPSPQPMLPQPAMGSGGIVDLSDGFQAAGGVSVPGGGATGTTGVDMLYGDERANHLIGGSSTDNLLGRDGADTLSGGSGFDILDGGMGIDFAAYADSVVGISVRLDQAFGYLGDADGDIYLNVEGIIGSSLSDTLVGTDVADTLMGGAGADTLVGGAGADQLMGGVGDDMYHIGASNGAGERIEDAGGADRIFFGKSIGTGQSLLDRLWFEVAGDDGDDVLVRILGTTDVIRIEDYQNSGRIEQLETEDFMMDQMGIDGLIAAMARVRDGGFDISASSINDTMNSGQSRASAAMAIADAWVPRS